MQTSDWRVDWRAERHVSAESAPHTADCVSASTFQPWNSISVISWRKGGRRGGEEKSIAYWLFPTIALEMKHFFFLPLHRAISSAVWGSAISRGWFSTAPQWRRPGPSQPSAGDKDPLSWRASAGLSVPSPLRSRPEILDGKCHRIAGSLRLSTRTLMVQLLSASAAIWCAKRFARRELWPTREKIKKTKQRREK